MSQKGQVAIEYLLVLAAIFVIIVVMMRPGGDFQQQLNEVAFEQANSIEFMANKIFN